MKAIILKAMGGPENLEHLKLIAPILAKYQISMEVVRFELCGELAEATLFSFRDAYGDRFEHYGFRI